LIILQLCLFASSRYTHVNYTWDNRIAFSHLFLKDWDPIREVDTYPPATGPMALYKVDEFFSTIDYAVLGVFIEIIFLGELKKIPCLVCQFDQRNWSLLVPDAR
jgi:hypothetical protein